MTTPNFSKYLSPKTIVNLFVIVGFLVFVVPVLSFLSKEIEQRVTSIATQRTEIATHARTISGLAKLRESSVAAEAAKLKLQALLPPRDDLFSFPRYMEGLGTTGSLGVDVNFVGKETPATAEGAGNNSFTMITAGTFADTLKFIKTAESINKFLISLNSIDMAKSGEGFDSTINGVVFFYD